MPKTVERIFILARIRLIITGLKPRIHPTRIRAYLHDALCYDQCNCLPIVTAPLRASDLTKYHSATHACICIVEMSAEQAFAGVAVLTEGFDGGCELTTDDDD